MLNQNHSNIAFNSNSEIYCDEYLDSVITTEEVFNVLKLSKNGKSPGYDDIQVELYKNPTALNALTRIFNICYDSGKVPVIWSKGVITPIPKSSTADPRDPLSYRGITLAPSSYKLYCGVLNARLTHKLDDLDFINDEQNGFRKSRSTIDHLGTLTSIIETRKLKKLSTFVAFIDFKKAYDWVNRNLLFTKLESLGISSKMLNALYSIYNKVQACVKLNGNLTEWFEVTSGLKQGCVLSPLLFNIFINSLVDDVKRLNIGVKLDEDIVSILVYADDVVFLADNENDLQLLLDTLNVWCFSNDLVVNLEKSKIVHFRTQSCNKTNFNFMLNGLNMSIVDRYTYLGLVLNEFLNFNETAKAVAKSASRSLGLLISKCKANGGFEHSVFTKLFDSLVMSVIEYGAAIWGSKDFSCINAVKNRAMRFFMGVGKYTPNLSLYGDMGWMPCVIKQWSCILRTWSRYTKMCNNRLNKKVFLWANRSCNSKIKNWNFRVHSKFRELDMSYLSNTEFMFDRNVIKEIENITFNVYKDKWHNDMNLNDRSKLRTYRLFKHEFGKEPYLNINMPGKYRSAFAKFRCGVAPIRIETGRYEGVDIMNRLCFNDRCVLDNLVENEKHVILNCPLYSLLRIELYDRASSFYPEFLTLSDDEKFIYLFKNENICFYTAKICHDILIQRKNVLYS